MCGWKGMQLNDIYIEVYLSLVNNVDQLVMAKVITKILKDVEKNYDASEDLKKIEDRNGF